MSTLGCQRLDAWLTREPPEPEDLPAPKCSRCGCFLVREPYGQHETVAISYCDGKPRVLDCVYDEHADAGILAIIGREKAGTSYRVAYPPVCGTKDGTSGEREFDGDIAPERAAEYEHAPHFFVESGWDYQTTDVRVCGHCGHYNEEPSW